MYEYFNNVAADISQFLLARIAEDEKIANEALAPEEMYPWGDMSLPAISAEQIGDEMRGYLGGTWGEHAANWEMLRVLRECKAKREIVDLYSAHAGYGTPGAALGLTALYILAEVYENHPEYKKEWGDG